MLAEQSFKMANLDNARISEIFQQIKNAILDDSHPYRNAAMGYEADIGYAAYYVNRAVASFPTNPTLHVTNEFIETPVDDEIYEESQTRSISSVMINVTTPRNETLVAEEEESTENKIEKSLDGIYHGDDALNLLLMRYDELKTVREAMYDENCKEKMQTLVSSSNFYGALPEYSKSMYEVNSFV